MKSVVFLLGLAMAFPAFAQEFTGNDLLRRCKGQPSEEAFCRAFIMGILRGYNIGVEMATPRSQEPRWTICIPANVTVSQSRDVVVRHLEQNPERRHREAGFLSVVALMESFPCPSRQ